MEVLGSKSVVEEVEVVLEVEVAAEVEAEEEIGRIQSLVLVVE